MSSTDLIIVGDEILHGEITDKNGPWLIDRLNEMGMSVRQLSVIGDDPDQIAETIGRARAHGVEYVFVTGGIGPTHDDRTQEGVARGLERETEPNDQVLEWLDHYYGDDINDARRRMADLPEDSEAVLLENTPAISFRTENVYVFPGIPELMRSLFELWVDKFDTRDHISRTLTVRAREGDIADPLDQLQDEFSGCRLGSYPHPDGTLTLKIRGPEEAPVHEAFEAVRDRFEDQVVEDE